MKLKTKNKIIVDQNLHSYFFEKLIAINNKSSQPLLKEELFYSSIVLDHYSKAKKFFEYENGKVREKVLGTKLRELEALSNKYKKKVLKDIADTALCLCGYFSESLKKKLLDMSYYQSIGKIAYRRLNDFVPKVYGISDFYYSFSDDFDQIANLITIVSLDDNSKESVLDQYVISKKSKAA